MKSAYSGRDSSRLGLHMMTGTISIFVAEAIILPTGFITAVFLARRLGPVGYGIFALASRLIVWLEWSSTTAFSGTTIKFVSETGDWKPIGAAIIRLHLLMGVSMGALLWILSSPLSQVFNEPAMAKYLKLFAIDIPIFSLASANRSILTGIGCFKERACVSAAHWVARLLLIVFFVEIGLSITGAIIGTICASIVELVIGGFYVQPTLLYGSRFPACRLLKFAMPLFLSNLSLRLFRLDLFALKVLGGTAAQAGFYGAALNLSMPPAIFSQSLTPPLLSTMSRMLSEGNESESKNIARTVVRSVFWLLPFVTMIAGAASEIVSLVFGETYLPASRILAFLIFAVLGLMTINVAKAILTALGKPGRTLILAGPMVPLALVGHLIWTVRLGGVGASLVTASVAWLGAFASIVAVYRTWRILPPLKTVFRSVICSGFAYALAILWPASALLLILKLITITLMILVGFVIFGEFTSNELSMVRLVLRSRLNLRQGKYEV